MTDPPIGDTVATLGERALIDRIRARTPAPPDWVPVAIGDDAAVVVPERNALDVVTTDALVEGVHFDCSFVPPGAIGHRALAANLSDLAAMGARPRAAVLSLGLPDRLKVAEFDAIIDGLLALGSTHGVVLVGGNIARSPGPLFVDITLLGSVQKRRILRRGGARPGDVLYVSGVVGSAAAGLEYCRAHPAEALRVGRGADPADRPLESAVDRFLYPDPRIRLGWTLARNRAARACVDLSDGLADAVHQLAAAGRVGAIVESDRVPIDPDVRRWFERDGRDPVLAAVTGGDDYELLFAMPARHLRLLEDVARRVGRLPLTRIGTVTRDLRVVLRRDDRDEPLPRGFTHFR